MKTVQEIIQEQQSKSGEVNQRSSTAGLLKAIILDAKNFFTNLFTNNSKMLANNKFDVEVKNQIVLPKVQQIDGSVSIKDAKALLIGLNEIIKGIKTINDTYSKTSKGLEKSLKPEKIDFSSLLKAIEDIYIPEPLKEVSVSNLPPDTTKELVAIKKEITKLKLNPTINVETKEPKVSIDLDGVKNQLKTLIEAVSEPDDEEPTGYSWTKNSEGNLSTFTEIYSDKKIVSTGWDIGRVEIK
jgi:hypothetical protein